jgi:hypothetical protein
MKLFIIDSQNVSKSINVMESDTVANLKKEIKKKNNIVGDIELVFDGDILNDNDSLDMLEIKDGMSINYLGVYNAGIFS